MESRIIFSNLLFNPDYARKVTPFLKPEYFEDRPEQLLLESIQKHSTEYNSIPTIDVIQTDIANKKGIREDEFKGVLNLLEEVKKPFKTPDLKWLLDNTEEFARASACHAAVVRSIGVLNGEDDLPRTAIPELLREALAVSLSTEIGHDYALNVEERYRKLHEQTARIKTGIKDMDEALGGGIPRKTLITFLAQTGGGKSLVKSHLAAHFYKQGYNVLYVTLELSEERIGERIDANLFGIDVLDIPDIPLEQYKTKVEKVAKNTNGRLFIKEYPPAVVSSSHLRALLGELKLKQDFVPDIIVVDYLNLMVSARYKPGSNNNSYTIVKAIAEELRSIAVENDAAVITSSQLNRSGFANSDVDMTSVSESIGLPATVDALFAIVRTEELDEMNQVLFKVLKTRFSDKTNHRFVCGINLNQMRVMEAGEYDQSKVSQEINPKDYNSKPVLRKANSEIKV